jgi:uncharacterized protein HemX
MAKSNKNTQLVVAGLAAAAAAGIIYYWLQQQQQNPATAKSKKLDDNNDRSIDVRSDDTVQTSNASGTATNTTTGSPTKKLDDDRLDEKALHAKIEELDKKGKTYFKDKQVRRFCLRDEGLIQCDVYLQISIACAVYMCTYVCI